MQLQSGEWGLTTLIPGGEPARKTQKTPASFFAFLFSKCNFKANFGYILKIKNPKIYDFGVFLAEKEGFEPRSVC